MYLDFTDISFLGHGCMYDELVLVVLVFGSWLVCLRKVRMVHPSTMGEGVVVGGRQSSQQECADPFFICRSTLGHACMHGDLC